MARRLEVVPDSERVEQRLLDESLVTPFVDARGVCTLSQLVDACEPTRWSGLSPADPLLVRALIADAAPVAARAFGPAARSAEFAAQVQVVLSQLRAQAVTPRQVLHAAHEAPSALGARAAALAELWQRLDAALAARQKVDPAGLVGLATERLLKEGLPPRLRDVSSVVVRFVHDLFPARLQFLEALATACHRADVGFELSWPASGEAAADVFVLDAVRQVEARWQTLDAEAFPDVSDGPLSWLGAATFAAHATKRPAPGLSSFSAASARDEAQEIARRVRGLVATGTPPETIAIVFRDLASDTERLVEALADVGVPVRARLGVPLPASPVGRLALGVLELVEDDFPAADVAALLESRHVTLLDAGAADPRRTFAEAGVRDDVIGATGTAGAYEARLAAHQARLRDPRAAKAVGLLREAVARLLALARSIPDEGPASEALEAFWDAITKLGVFDSLARATSSPSPIGGEGRGGGTSHDRAVERAPAGRDGARVSEREADRLDARASAVPGRDVERAGSGVREAEASRAAGREAAGVSERGPRRVGASALLAREVDRALARDQAAGEALGRLVSDVKAAFRESGFGRRTLRRRDFARWLRHAAADVNLVARGPRTGAVWLLDAREVAGRHFQHVFLGGLVDGRFPGRPAPQPLFSEAERGVLNQLAGAPLFRLGVADGEQRMPVRLAEDRLLFHLVLASAERTVTLSRPRFDDAGRELLGSSFLDGVRQAVDGLDERVLARSPLPSLDDAATEAELRARAALEVLGPPGTRQTVADARREALAAALAGEAWLDDARLLSAAEAERLGFFSDEARAAGPFSGQVTPTDALDARLDFHAERAVSAAELNAWGQCAFRGLGLYVLGLEGAEAAGEEPDARVNGTFLHDALERLVPALARAGLLGKADVDAPTLATHVEAAVREAAAKTQARAPTGHPELWALHQARTVRQLTRLVREGAVLQPFGPATVDAVELRFGDGERSAPGLERVVLPAALDDERDVHVRGRIDRVDVMPGQVGVLDYKTSPKNPGEVAEALLASDFQLPFYLWAMRQHRPGTAVTGAWVGIKRPKALRLEAVLAEKEDGDVTGLLASDAPTRRTLADEGKPNLPNAVHGLLAKLRAGDFGARATSCRYCELKAVCRISARKLPEER